MCMFAFSFSASLPLLVAVSFPLCHTHKSHKSHKAHKAYKAYKAHKLNAQSKAHTQTTKQSTRTRATNKAHKAHKAQGTKHKAHVKFAQSAQTCNTYTRIHNHTHKPHSQTIHKAHPQSARYLLFLSLAPSLLPLPTLCVCAHVREHGALCVPCGLRVYLLCLSFRCVSFLSSASAFFPFTHAIVILCLSVPLSVAGIEKCRQDGP
jgi:hypothetical protein